MKIAVTGASYSGAISLSAGVGMNYDTDHSEQENPFKKYAYPFHFYEPEQLRNSLEALTFSSIPTGCGSTTGFSPIMKLANTKTLFNAAGGWSAPAHPYQHTNPDINRFAVLRGKAELESALASSAYPIAYCARPSCSGKKTY